MPITSLFAGIANASKNRMVNSVATTIVNRHSLGSDRAATACACLVIIGLVVLYIPALESYFYIIDTLVNNSCIKVDANNFVVFRHIIMSFNFLPGSVYVWNLR